MKKVSILGISICMLILAMPAFAREGINIRSLIPTEEEAAQDRMGAPGMDRRSEYESPASRATANRAREARETRSMENTGARDETTRYGRTERAGSRESNRAERYQENLPSRSNRYQRSGAVIYSGNTDTLKFHHPDCRYYYCKACTRTFNSRQEALNAGYNPCQICGAQ